MNIQLILIHTALFMFLFPPGITEKPATDTLRIKTEGTGNQIRVDSAWFSRSPADTVITAGATGEIKQTGENNRVEINTGVEIPKNKIQITNKDQKSNNKNHIERATCNPEPATIKIEQTGNNNSVKINQR